MNTIINIRENIKIVQDSTNKNIYSIHFSSYNAALINSIIKTRILLGATSTNNYKTIMFKASTVETFYQFREEQLIPKLSTPMAAKMLQNLTQQLKYLNIQEYKTIIGYNPENIIVIDRERFIYLCSEYLLDIDPNSSTFTITFPFSREDFIITPELSKIIEIPTSIHYKSSVFSLGCLILYVLTGDDNLLLKIISEDENYLSLSLEEYVNKYLDSLPINGSKFYWLLKRTLVEEPEKRCILFI